MPQWDTQEALNWIIYRGREPDEIDTALTEGLHMNDDIMGCLWARAEGDPRSWAPDARPPVGAEYKPPRYSGKSQVFWGSLEVGLDGKIERVFTAASCRARMRRWMRDTKKPASELFAHAVTLRDKANALIGAENAKVLDALAQLNNAARGGLLPVRGCERVSVSRPSCNPVRVEVPKEQFDELRQIDVMGDISVHEDPEGFKFLDHNPPFYSELEFEPAIVKQLWPHGRPMSPQPASRKFAPASLESWVIDRYKEFPLGSRLPGFEKEWKAAQDDIPDLSRASFLAMLDKLRPERDRSTGRPPSSKNSPENSRRHSAS